MQFALASVQHPSSLKGISFEMAHILARRALRALTQVDSASCWRPVSSGVQTFGRREDDEERDSHPSPAHALELEVPDSSRNEIGGSPQSCHTFATAMLSRQFTSSPFGALSYLQTRLLHSSSAGNESAVGPAAEVTSVQAPAGAAVRADPVRDTKALLRTATLTILREQLRDHERAWISLPELYKMCRETGELW